MDGCCFLSLNLLKGFWVFEKNQMTEWRNLFQFWEGFLRYTRGMESNIWIYFMFYGAFYDVWPCQIFLYPHNFLFYHHVNPVLTNKKKSNTQIITKKISNKHSNFALRLYFTWKYMFFYVLSWLYFLIFTVSSVHWNNLIKYKFV